MLENEILKEAEDAENRIFRPKNVIFWAFLASYKISFPACTTLLITL